MKTDGNGLIVIQSAGLRYAAQSHELAINLGGTPEEVVARFEDAHERLYGTRLGDPVEIVDARVDIRDVRRVRNTRGLLQMAKADTASETVERECLLLGTRVPAHSRSALPDGVSGPCLVEERNTVTVIPTGATAKLVGPHLVVML